jgi:predicted DNA-binding transcriptional regulator AlpA
VTQHIGEKALALRLGMSARTLQRWRWKGKGPNYLKLGGRVVYRISDVEAWEERSLKQPAPISGSAA